MNNKSKEPFNFIDDASHELVEGYRLGNFKRKDISVPVLLVSASQEKLATLFSDLIETLGKSADIELLSHHERDNYYSCKSDDPVETIVLRSALADFDSLVEEDCYSHITIKTERGGCLEGITLHPSKNIIVSSRKIGKFKQVIQDYDIPHTAHAIFGKLKNALPRDTFKDDFWALSRSLMDIPEID